MILRFIRDETLRPALDPARVHPTGNEVRLIAEMIKHETGIKITGGRIGMMLGLEVQTSGSSCNSRTYRRWVSSGDQPSSIPYAAWAILAHAAGYKFIWRPKGFSFSDQPFTGGIRDLVLASGPDWVAPLPTEFLEVESRIAINAKKETASARQLNFLIGGTIGLALHETGASSLYRAWVTGAKTPSYAHWALMVDLAGLGVIWRP